MSFSSTYEPVIEVAGDWIEGVVFVFLGDGSVGRVGRPVNVAEGLISVRGIAVGGDCSADVTGGTVGCSTVWAPRCRSSVMVRCMEESCTEVLAMPTAPCSVSASAYILTIAALASRDVMSRGDIRPFTTWELAVFGI